MLLKERKHGICREPKGAELAGGAGRAAREAGMVGSKSLMGADRHPELIKHSWENTFEQFRSGTRSAWISGYKLS